MVIRSFSRRCSSLSCRILSLITAVIFAFSPIIQPVAAFAQGSATAPLNLPAPGSMVAMSENFTPLYIKGITIHPDDPLQFSFIMDSGNSGLEGEALKEESQKLIKYFLAALTVPEDELWVNLSPYERANMIPERFGYTEMGRDLLAQDYMLKQITASVMYPEGKTGSAFWSRIQEKVKEKFGITDVPVNMFNKIWIIPDKAEVYEINGTAYVVDSHLKVMLEEDYFALKSDTNRSTAVAEQDEQAIGAVSSDVVREVLLPEIEKEVNEGKNFANLRQIYNASILATWYKMNLRESLLGQVYIDKNKVSGVDAEDKSAKLQIYEQYVAAFKKGAYEMVKKDYDPATQQVTTRKYFSGGIVMRPPVETSPSLTFSSQKEFQGLSSGEQQMAGRAAQSKGNVSVVGMKLVVVDQSRAVVPSQASSESEGVLFQAPLLRDALVSQSPEAIEKGFDRTFGNAFSVSEKRQALDVLRNLARNFSEYFRGSTQDIAGKLSSSGELNPSLAQRIASGIPEFTAAISGGSPVTPVRVEGQEYGVRLGNNVTEQRAAEMFMAMPSQMRDQVSAVVEEGDFAKVGINAAAMLTNDGHLVTRPGVSAEALGQPGAIRPIGMSFQELNDTMTTSQFGAQPQMPVKEVAVGGREVGFNPLEFRSSGEAAEIVTALPRTIQLQVSDVRRAEKELPDNMVVVFSPVDRVVVVSPDATPEKITAQGTNIPQMALSELRPVTLATLSGSPALFIEKETMASAAITVGADTRRSMDEMDRVFSASSPVRASGAGGKIARIVASLLTAATFSTASMDMDKFTGDVHAEMNRAGMEKLIPAVNKGELYQSFAAIANPIAPEAAQLPTKWNQLDVDQNGLGTEIVTQEIRSRTTDLGIEEREVPQVVSVMKKVDFGNYAAKRLAEKAFSEQGLRKQTAGRLSDIDVIRDISRALGSKTNVNDLSAGLPVLLLTNRAANTASVREILRNTDIDAQVIDRLALEIVEMAAKSPASFSTPERFEADVSRKFTPQIGKIVASPPVIVSMINAAGYEAHRAEPGTKGGIDINPALLKLLVKRDGNGVPVPVGNVNLKDTDIYGFEPVISKVEQVDSLPAFIGIGGAAETGTAGTIR